MPSSPTTPRLIVRLSSSLCALTLAACASSTAPTVVVKQASAAVDEAAREAPAAAAASHAAAYDPTGRDPFRSYLDTTGPEPTPDAPPLARYALGSLKVIGVVSSVATPMAMVTTPEGKGYRVRIGDRIGHHEGRVHAIRRDAVVVAETFYDPILGRRQVLQTLGLRETPLLPPAEALKAYE